MKAYERFLKYVSVWTTSDETSETVPSADRELVLAELLVEEMKELDGLRKIIHQPCKEVLDCRLVAKRISKGGMTDE